MNRRLQPTSRKTSQFLLASVLCLIAGLYLAGCSLGPIEIGGPDATPTPSGPTATATPPPRALTGRVEDAYTGKPIEGAEITAGGVLTATTSDGMYYFDDVPKGTKLTVSADGYSKTEIDTGTVDQLPVKLRPSTVSGRVTDASTGKPLAGVLVKLVSPSAAVTSTGTLTSPATITSTVVVTATQDSGQEGFGKGLAAPQAAATHAPPTRIKSIFTVTPTDEASVSDSSPESEDTATTEPSAITDSTDTPTPLPATSTPVPAPKLVPPTGPDFVAMYTDENGNYSFKDAPAGATLTFKMPGYKLTKIPVGEGTTKDVALDVFKVEAAYMTANIAASKDLYDDLVKFLVSSRINAIVLNVQSDASEWVFDTKNPDALKAKNTDMFLKDIPDVVKDLKSKGFYTIARIVTFQQKTMAEARPDWAIKSSVTGKPWKGGYAGQQRWLDASNPQVQDHLISMTKEVLALGFDEVQYDYVRFPSDPAPNEPGEMVFSRPLTDTGKIMALQQFLQKAHNTIEPTDAFMSIDVFGYSLWPNQDGKPILGVIGQVLEYIEDYTDYVSPMIYPSHFSAGELGCAQPAKCAYQLIKQSGEYAAERFKGHKVKYRPWLQDFDWVGVDYTSPGTTKVAEQIEAARETNAWGWLWWDPANEYLPRSAFKKGK